MNPAYFLGAALAIVIILFGLNVGGFRGRVFGGKGSAEPALRLAVLPFANLSGDPEQEYLSDGLTQELITQIGRLQPAALSVIARTSVMRYKKAETPIDQIGRELSVNFLLEGSVQREANRVRITAELINVGDQTQLWADTYERELSAVLIVQSQVAQNVAKALAVELLPAEQARLAWVWLARRQMGIVPYSEAPKVKSAALQSLALDENSAEAHEVLAARYEKSQYFSAHGVALRYLDGGDKDKAIEWLYKAYEDRDQSVPYLGLPEWTPSRADPRFQALLRRVGLPVDGQK